MRDAVIMLVVAGAVVALGLALRKAAGAPPTATRNGGSGSPDRIIGGGLNEYGIFEPGLLNRQYAQGWGFGD